VTRPALAGETLEGVDFCRVDHLLDDTGDHGGRLAPASGRAVGSPVRSCHWSASTGKNYQGEPPAQIIHYGAARASWPDTFIAAQIGGYLRAGHAAQMADRPGAGLKIPAPHIPPWTVPS
jgi:hypothetical protein